MIWNEIFYNLEAKFWGVLIMNINFSRHLERKIFRIDPLLY